MKLPSSKLKLPTITIGSKTPHWHPHLFISTLSMLQSLAVLCLAQFHPQSKEAAAETARWTVHRAGWGFLTSLDEHGQPVAEVASFSDGAEAASSGRVFFYLMGNRPLPAALTISEASFDGTCGFAGSKVDPEDPRCAKITLSGQVKESSGDDIAIGKRALFARHPQMAHWPAGHGFAVCELRLEDIWMIDFYGGAQNIKLAGICSRGRS